MAVQAWYVGTFVATLVGEWFIDWATYSRAVGRWVTGQAIYPAEQLGGPYYLFTMSGSGYAYPPASVPLMTPFAPAVGGLVLWELLIVGLYLSGLWAVVSLGFPRRRLEAFGVVLLATAFYFPAMQGFVAGNVNMATAGLIAWAWAGLPRPGIVAGVFGILKVFPAGVAVLYGARAVVVALTTMVVIVLVTLPFVGLSSWSDFATALGYSQPACPHDALIPSFACFVEPAVGTAVARFASLAVAAVLLVVAAIAGPTLVGVSAVVAAIMVPSADLHFHYWSMVLVLLVIAVARFARMRRGEVPDPASTPFSARWSLAALATRSTA
jgi:hypothetical protein